MKLNTADFLRKCQFPLMIALGTLPVGMLIMQHNTPEATGTLALLYAAFVLLSWLCMVLPGKARLPAGILSCALMMALGLQMLPIMQITRVNSSTVSVGQGAFSLLVPLALCILLLDGLKMAGWPREREIAFNWYAAGVIAHLFVLFIVRAERLQGITAWDTLSPILTVAFIAFLLLVMLSMNRVTIAGASLGRQQVPLSMRRRNTAFTICLLLLALLIAAFPAIARFIERAWSLTVHVVGTVIAFIASLLEQEGLTAGMGGPADSMMPVLSGDTQPGLLAKILEVLATLLAGVAIVVFTVFAVRFLVRKAAELVRALRARLAQYMASASQDYIDEITDTREEGGEQSGTLLERLRRSLAFVNERRLTPAERIRYRYRLLLRKHPDWHQSRTARENLHSSAAVLYEQARYSGQDMTAGQADQFTSDVKNA